MTHFQQHKQFFDNPIFLTEEEKMAPLEVIKDFFSTFSFSEIREIHERID